MGAYRKTTEESYDRPHLHCQLKHGGPFVTASFVTRSNNREEDFVTHSVGDSELFKFSHLRLSSLPPPGHLVNLVFQRHSAGVLADATARMGDASEDFSAIQNWIIGGNVFLASRVLFYLDYFHTLEDEVHHIWPERWTLGKILFLATRYFVLASGPYICWASFVTGNSMKSAKEYLIHIDTLNVLTVITTYLPTATLFLCLHALLGAGRVTGYVMLGVYLGMLATSCTLMGNHLSLSYLIPSPYPSLYPFEYQAKTWAFRIAGNYWLFARELCMFLFGSFVMYRRYRTYIRRQSEAGVQNDWILVVIRRDGAIYYVASLAVTLYTCITYTPGFPVIVRDLLNGLQNILHPLIANHLLLDLRRSESPDIQTAVSTLLFTSALDIESKDSDLVEKCD